MGGETQTLRDGFLLDRWKVEPRNGSITSKDGVRHRVTPHAMEVLVALAEVAPEIASRQSLIEKVWGPGQGSDEGLTHCISELRHLFGDHSDAPEYLQTIRKQGYRLIASMGTIDDARNSDASPVSSQIDDLRKRKVFQVLLGYPVLAWLLVQILDVLWDYLLRPLGAPEWIVPSLVVLLAVGYPVAVFLAWAVDITPEGVKVTKPGRSSRNAAGLIAIGVVSLAIPAGGLFLYFNALEGEETISIATPPAQVPPVRFDRSIAVLRFENISPVEGTDYISDGLTEELIHELVNLKTIKVASRTAVWDLPVAEMEFNEIGELLRVERILEGSVRVEGDNLRITTQLIDENGFHLWSQTYDDKLENVLELQKDIAVKVVDELDVLLADKDLQRLNSHPTEDSEAYDRYLQGLYYLRQPRTHESLDRAQAHFMAATELDNRFPLGFSGLCETHLARYRITRDTDYFSQAEIACHRALTLDGGLAEVYTALGNLYRHSGQYIKAEQEYLAALKVNPTLEEATYGLGRSYQGQGRLLEAEEILLRNLELEPGYWGTYLGIGNFLYRQGRYAESVPHYEKVTELVPDYAGGYINLGSALHWLGDWDGADVAWRRALELDENPISYHNMGTLRFYQHEFEEAADYFQQGIEAAPEDHRNWGKIGAALRFIPEHADTANAYYEKAIELVEARLAINPDDAEELYYSSTYRLRMGDINGAREDIERSLALEPQGSNGHYFAALIEIEVGNLQNALIRLEKAAELGYSLRLMAADPDLRALHGDAGFQQLIRQQ